MFKRIPNIRDQKSFSDILNFKSIKKTKRRPQIIPKRKKINDAGNKYTNITETKLSKYVCV